MYSITKKNPADEMTLEQIRAAVATNEREEAEEAKELAAARRGEREAQQARRAQVAATRAELARDTKTTEEGLLAALDIRSQGRDRTLEPIFAQLRALFSPHIDDIDIGAAIEARHVLAAADVLPAVRRDDRIFGGDAAKRIRELPAILPRHIGVADIWFEQFTRRNGIPYEPYHPEPRADGETELEARERVARQRERGLYHKTDARKNEALAARELELLDQKHHRARLDALAAHRKQTSELRAAIVATIDGVVAKLETGVTWWWARELRRWFAGERTRIGFGDFERVHVTLDALGVRFDFTSTGAKP